MEPNTSIKAGQTQGLGQSNLIGMNATQFIQKGNMTHQNNQAIKRTTQQILNAGQLSTHGAKVHNI